MSNVVNRLWGLKRKDGMFVQFRSRYDKPQETKDQVKHGFKWVRINLVDEG